MNFTRHVLLCMLSLVLLLVSTSRLSAAEYFLSLDGNDANDGTSLKQAFATLQKGIDTLKPGDTLTIAPGEYFGHAYRENIGGPEADTTIRAMIPRTVTIRGDQPISGFQKVEGYQFVYSVDCDKPVQGVLELSTPTNLLMGFTLQELEFQPGKWMHDVENGKLYVSSSNLLPVTDHQYSIGLTPTHGIYLLRAQRVIIEGLVVTGFQSKKQISPNPGHYAAWGIILSNSNDSIIRHCTAYLNGGGISFRDGSEVGKNNLIDHCVAFANDCTFSVEVGNIIIFSTNNSTISNSYTYGSKGNGLRHYGAGISGPAIVRNVIAWGNKSNDYFLKGGPIAQFGLVENSVALGRMHSHNVKNNIVGSINQYNREMDASTIKLRDIDKHSPDQFADPDNLDFRLQATSRFIGKGLDGKDAGPYPYQPNIFFVRPDGSDRADGLSNKHAWRSLKKAFHALRPGDTLYLNPGQYEVETPLSIQGSVEKPVRIRGRGIDPIILTGKLQVSDASHVSFERLHFKDGVSVTGSSEILFRNNGFYAGDTSLQASNINGLRLSHNVFTGYATGAVTLASTADLFVDGNLFDNAAGPALVMDDATTLTWSNYNNYTHPQQAWKVNGSVRTLEQLQPDHERYASTRPAQFASGQAYPVLENAMAFRSGGPRGEALGIHLEYRPRQIVVTPPRVHSMTSTTANIEWMVSIPTNVSIAWGPTPACENTMDFEAETYSGFSLTGLEPGKEYFFTVRSVTPTDEHNKQLYPARSFDSQPLSFTTPTTPHQPMVYYVAPDGDDSHSGKSREEAWKTVTYAGSKVLAGDTVLIGEGTYQELVNIRGTGDKDAWITFKAIPGEMVTFDGQQRTMGIAFQADRKHYIHIDSLYFQQFGLKGWEGILTFWNCSNLKITRCFNNGQGAGIGPHILNVNKCADILLANNVQITPMYGMAVRDGVRNMRVENNVHIRPFITHANISGPGQEHAVQFRKNIYTDDHPGKVKVHMFELGGFEGYLFENNAFFLRIPDDQRKPFLFYASGPGRISVAEYEQKSGFTGNMVVDPKFAIVPETPPTDRNGKPYEWVGDWVVSQRPIDFPDLFATNPQVVSQGIGLQPEAFEDFHFNKNKSAAAASKADANAR